MNEKSNILWVVDHMGYCDVPHGAGNYYLNMIPQFNKEKFNIILCVLRGKQHLYQKLVDLSYKVYYLNKGKTNVFTIPELLRIVKLEKIDLLHLSGYGSANFGRIVSTITKIPNILHAYDEHNNYPWTQKFSDYLLKNKTTQAIAVSEAVKRSCINQRSLCENKIKVSNIGIPNEKFVEVIEGVRLEFKRKFCLNQDFPVVGSVSRLREEKGIKYLIKAASLVLSKFPNVYFFICGEGPQMDELKSFVNELNVQDRVILSGYCEDAKVVLSILDIFVLPSETEGFSTSVLEAMAQKKPIIATNVGGNSEMLIDNETGLLIPPLNPDIIAKKIMMLLNDKELRIKLGENAYNSCHKWKLESLVKDLENLYLKMLSRN